MVLTLNRSKLADLPSRELERLADTFLKDRGEPLFRADRRTEERRETLFRKYCADPTLIQLHGGDIAISKEKKTWR